LISVIIPTKGRNSLGRTIASIEDQDYQDTNIIVSEDYELNGASWARNQGAKVAAGEFYFFCDDDVTLNENCLSKLKDALDENPDASYAYCGYYRSGLFNSSVDSKPFNWETLKRVNFISTMSLIRAKDFIGFDESLKRFQDWDMWIRMYNKGKYGVYVAENLFTAHYEGDCITNNDTNKIAKATNIVKEKNGLL